MLTQVEPSPPPSPKTQTAGQGVDAGPKKAPKPKKPKIKRFGTADVAARIDIKEVERVLEGIEQKYSTDESVQLEIFTDHFLTLFKDADIPFNKIVLEGPPSKASISPFQLSELTLLQDRAVGIFHRCQQAFWSSLPCNHFRRQAQ